MSVELRLIDVSSYALIGAYPDQPPKIYRITIFKDQLLESKTTILKTKISYLIY